MYVEKYHIDNMYNFVQLVYNITAPGVYHLDGYNIKAFNQNLDHKNEWDSEVALSFRLSHFHKYWNKNVNCC